MEKYINLSRKNLNFSFQKYKNELIKMTDTHCQKCGKKVLDKYDLILDHKIPVKIGNRKLIFDKNNLWILCRKCNSKKLSKDKTIIFEMIKKNFFSKGSVTHILYMTHIICIKYYKKRFKELAIIEEDI